LRKNSIGSPRSLNNRARLVDLEVKVDIDPLTELLNPRSFERELKRRCKDTHPAQSHNVTQ
jgi:GGDEF domain-containing protein